MTVASDTIHGSLYAEGRPSLRWPALGMLWRKPLTNGFASLMVTEISRPFGALYVTVSPVWAPSIAAPIGDSGLMML